MPIYAPGMSALPVFPGAMPVPLPNSVGNQVLIGNPISKAPSTIGFSANNISVFNTNNTNSCFVNPTSDLLNRHIFSNAHAGLPLTIFVGKNA